MQPKHLISYFVTAFLLLTFHAYPQTDKGFPLDSLDGKFLNWYNLDPVRDGIQGASVNKAYSELLTGKTASRTIVVAVIDGGVDIEHPDLAGKIWTNPKEIAGNGIDDDQNGYTDDIHGWNFLGNSKGENIQYENLEYVRIFKALNPKYIKVTNPDVLNAQDKKEYQVYMKARIKYREELAKYQDRETNFSRFEDTYYKNKAVLEKYLHKSNPSLEEIQSVDPKSPEVDMAKSFMISIMKNGFAEKYIPEVKKEIRKYLDYLLNVDFNPRFLIKDDPDNISDKNYGNNDVIGPRAQHGTFVSGIIAANRNDGIGIDGIAGNVRIMVLRVVPDGDERDKDVALAIRYAVDNGANIINMSFGKYFSNHKEFVDAAIKYADEHQVLMIHAAGNDALDLDRSVHYPTNELNDGIRVSNWVTVGASSSEFGKSFCGVFSNYGRENVDLFAPGVNMISCFPENTYHQGDGTSFSAPVVSGVAALIWSYNPSLTSKQLKEVLLSGINHYPKSRIYKPNITSSKKSKTKFFKLSVTGGTVNVYQSLQNAAAFKSK